MLTLLTDNLVPDKKKSEMNKTEADVLEEILEQLTAEYPSVKDIRKKLNSKLETRSANEKSNRKEVTQESNFRHKMKRNHDGHFDF